MLTQYNRKRHFDKTKEPRGTRTATASKAARLHFVVQEHSASHLHYDFRLENNGVLKSWAVPKGPSLDPDVKRLAIQVEDHPLDYAGFEGVIPKGEYGGGEVIVWDKGTYELITGDKPPLRSRRRDPMTVGLEVGRLHFVLFGQKLTGEWILIRTKNASSSPQWLLKKTNSESEVDLRAVRDVLVQDKSVLSGRTVEQLKSKYDAEPAPLPEISLVPMLATPTDAPFDDPEWLFEPKLDGMRLLAHLDLTRVGSTRVALTSRTSRDSTHLFPNLAKSLMTNQTRSMVLDGEVIATNTQGRPSFETLQLRINLSSQAEIEASDKSIPVVYYVFDILALDGRDLRRAPLSERKALLESCLKESENCRSVHGVVGDGVLAFTAAVEQGFEGLVAKRLDSRYASGKRSENWLKIKATLSDDFVIGGFTRGTGNRSNSFGSLLVGQYVSDRKSTRGSLVFCGHVGTGFDGDNLAMLTKTLVEIASDRCPFAAIPETNAAATWVKPRLLAEVKFANRTSGGQLRSPVFVRLRSDMDKKPEEAVTQMPIHSHGSDNNMNDNNEATQDLVELVSNAGNETELALDGNTIHLSHLDKELWPAAGTSRAVTKRDLVSYFLKIAKLILPHLAERPVTLARYPHGLGGTHFFQRHLSPDSPEFLHTVAAYSEDNDKDVEYVLCENSSSLVWLAQMGNLEIHSWLSRISPGEEALPIKFSGSEKNIDSSALNYPDCIGFDLDPYIYSGNEKTGDEPEFNHAAFAKTVEIALDFKDLLVTIGLVPFVKTSGKTGLHIYVPIVRKYTFDQVRQFCKTLCLHVERDRPTEVTLEWNTAKRAGKVFLDYNMNARSKTIAAAFSPRATPGALVSTPVSWEELPTVQPGQFDIYSIPDRFKSGSDPWKNMQDQKRDIGQLLS